MKVIDDGIASIVAEVRKIEEENTKYKEAIKKLSAKNRELEESVAELAQLKTKLNAIKEMV